MRPPTGEGMERPRPLTNPADSVRDRPQGLPMANTDCPTCAVCVWGGAGEGEGVRGAGGGGVRGGGAVEDRNLGLRCIGT